MTMAFDSTMLVLAWAAIIMALAMSGILRQLHALESVRLPPLTLNSSVLTDFGDQKNASCLFFVEPGCPSCERLLQRLPTLVSANSDGPSFVVVPVRGRIEFQDPNIHTAAQGTEWAEALGIPATPYGAVIRSDGHVALTMPLGSDDAVDQFIASAQQEVISA